MSADILSQPENPDHDRLLTLCVSRVPIFNHLPLETLSVIANKASMRAYQRGQFIHRAGEASNKLFIVHKGKIKVYRLADTGKEQLLRILKPGDFAGELALFSATAHDSYAEAMEASEICTIYQDDVQNLLREYPAISLHVLSELSRRLETSEKQTAAIATTSINARLAHYLIDLTEKSGSNSVSLPMSRKYLASFLGTTPETVSRRLGEFENAGLITQTGQRKITIIDLEALLQLE